MAIEFDFQNVVTTEFGVGLDELQGQTFYFVPSDLSVQAALRDMAIATRDATQAVNASKYEPSEKHAGEESLYLPLDDDLAAGVRVLHEAANLGVNSNVLGKAEKIFCYFVRLTDGAGHQLTGVRRATQFKGVLKSRLIRLVTDALQLVEDKVFKLDKDFDFLIDAAAVHILRPSGFEFAGKLQAAVLAAVPENVETVQKQLKFVDFGPVGDYAAKHPRAARCLASILSQPLKAMSRSALTKLCRANSVEIENKNGKMIVPFAQMIAFLEVLDRRRYNLELIKGSPERFRAASRQKVQ